MNTGPRPRASAHGLLTTVGWRIKGEVTYALEGSVFVAGAAVQWLRDGLGIITTAAESEALAASVPDTQGVYFVPAFVGLGAPYWDSEARGALLGLTRGVTRAHIARATLEALCFQTRDVVECMAADAGQPVGELRVDGGAVANDLLMEMQADLLGVAVQRAAVRETTALGAAYLAGLATGVWTDTAQLARLWRSDRVFTPSLPAMAREERYAGWRQAVATVHHNA
jgi:glycerol kinase